MKTYREMFEYLQSKGVKVNYDGATGYNGWTPTDGCEFLKWWMVRINREGWKYSCFCCGLDLIGDDKVWINGEECPMDENILDHLMDAVKRSYGRTYPAEDIQLSIDYDCYMER